LLRNARVVRLRMVVGATYADVLLIRELL